MMKWKILMLSNQLVATDLLLWDGSQFQWHSCCSNDTRENILIPGWWPWYPDAMYPNKPNYGTTFIFQKPPRLFFGGDFPVRGLRGGRLFRGQGIHGIHRIHRSRRMGMVHPWWFWWWFLLYGYDVVIICMRLYVCVVNIPYDSLLNRYIYIDIECRIYYTHIISIHDIQINSEYIRYIDVLIFHNIWYHQKHPL